MLKYLVATAALVVAGVPAAVGLAGNASFTRDVPVRVPEQAQTTTPTSAPTADDDGTADQGRGEVEPGDDHGGDVPRDDRTEAGDDRDHTGEAEPGDDHGGTSGHDGSDDATDDHGGGDNSGDDDSGSGSTSSGSSGSGSGDVGSDNSGSGSDDSGSGSDDGGSSGGGSDDGSGHN